MENTFKKPPKALPKSIKKLQELASRQIPMKITEKIKLKMYDQQYGTYYICPLCKISLERDFMSYCDRCGQRLDWRGYKKAKIINNSDT